MMNDSVMVSGDGVGRQHIERKVCLSFRHCI